ncbi:plasmid pRiA4b ORF-3 family protein [Bradyrhizobium sp. WYCCWR 13023]|uniref:Plasmid pRiA4b ORF-3 family protein n=1 Tax=Bradyrhizobium zhengyangense TaxID=2911009 RepID=A0A9X1UBN2_9BRAD|nr:plasmid pRiA4b ORF-3 family protein [Bradyrhizobium zhengyangense]MCG2632355.1 plasmid pRiA4b ORF-3 family protein [Bradyrhizobium zhengyangense]
MSLNTTAVRIRVTLKDVKPEVMRCLVVPITLRLDRLHLTLQAAFGWTNSHLFEFLAGDGRWSIPDPDGDFDPQPIDARKTRLSNIVQESGAKTIHYLYDFGDSWDHVIKLEKWFDNTTTEDFPSCLRPPAVVLRKMSAARQAMPNTSTPSATPPIRSTNKCASGAPSSSIPTSSTGRRLRPPSMHCRKYGSLGDAPRAQNSRQAPSKRAAELRLLLIGLGAVANCSAARRANGLTLPEFDLLVGAEGRPLNRDYLIDAPATVSARSTSASLVELLRCKLVGSTSPNG